VYLWRQADFRRLHWRKTSRGVSCKAIPAAPSQHNHRGIRRSLIAVNSPAVFIFVSSFRDDVSSQGLIERHD
jgi:hypothetical protein